MSLHASFPQNITPYLIQSSMHVKKKYARMIFFIPYKHLKLSYKYPFMIMKIKEHPGAVFFLDIFSVKCNSIFNLI